MAKLAKKLEDALVADALAARATAYAPYSRFLVGAALLCDDGTVVKGCNVENASYGLCICAERTAASAAVSQGKQKFRAIAIDTSSTPPSPPCGMCRQFLSEFAPALDVILVNDKGARTRTNLSKLFPGTFTPALLKSGTRR